MTKSIMTTATTANAKYTFTKERYLEILRNFASFVNHPSAKPVYHEKGHKMIDSAASFETFIFHAMISGKNPEITTHDANSDSYKEALCRVVSNGFTRELATAFGMTFEEVELVIGVFTGEVVLTSHSTPLSLERTIEVCKVFRKFVNNKESKPWKCEKYGTKYSGMVTHEHFILYAALRGKNPAETSHNPESEEYKEKIAKLQSLIKYNNGALSALAEQYCNTFSIEHDEFVRIVNTL